MMLDTPKKLACPELLDLAGGRLALLGSRCRACGEVYFPASHGCTRCCATDMEPYRLGSEGTLWSWTIQGFRPKAPYNGGESEADFRPYGVGYVEMPSGVKVESRLSVADPALLAIGMPMILTLQAYRQVPGEAPVYTYAFAPA
ncbi:Zn-ribbon domain-containing OB-fold protein [Zoogloea sp. LCSB751]|uniref:Zn-ribbon domain-containing OB-fold protein n=1 Tax=Zoogloea sp. LCSB751 TaxID=1965277 RepID=UPI0009A54A01|nr:OB-fold domain-containing protein [Zoogloea sp. LCSB751]